MKNTRYWLAAGGALLIAGSAWASFVLTRGIKLTQADTSYLGEASGDLAGQAVSSVGDINGDGVADLVVGAPYADAGGILDSGRIYIIFGHTVSQSSTWATGVSLSKADVVLSGEALRDYFGAAITGLGDVNGDGKNDFAVSSYNNGDNGSGAGKVYIVMGRTSGWPKSASISAIADASLVGEQTEGAGYSISTAGDLNGDSLDDLVIGNLHYRYSSTADYAGRAYVVLGKKTGWGQKVVLSTTADAQFIGETANQLVGRAVAGGGDIDGDGYDDLIIGAPGDIGATTARGQVGIIFGKSAFKNATPQKYSQAVAANFLGEFDFDYAGQAVAMLADVNDDGRSDIMIGAPGFSPSSTTKGAGKVYLILGRAKTDFVASTSLSQATASWIGEISSDSAGASLSGAGYLNSDPYHEIMVGAYRADSEYYNTGKTYILFGRASGWPQSGKLSDAEMIISGTEVDGQSGISVAGNLDIDNDHFRDLAIGAFRTDLSSSVKDAGSVFVLRGVLMQDQDGDGYSPLSGDCDDEDSSSSPKGVEVPYDGIDQNCDGEDLIDVDGDGYDASAVGGNDCNDKDVKVYPGATEVCNGIDDNCSGAIDEGVLATYYTDSDSDGYGDPAKKVLACSPLAGTVTNASDCDDGNASIHPGSVDIPYDGIDQDCSGADLADVDGDGQRAASVGGKDCDDDDPTVYQGATELPYNGVDEDCSGADLTDVDGDGYVWDGLPVGDDCNDNSASVHPGAVEVAYDGIDQDCNKSDLTDVDGDGQSSTQVAGGTDCDDSSTDIYAGAVEIINDGIDQDCSGQDLIDSDDDGHGSISTGGDDCDDRDFDSYPGASEVAYDGIDQNCDGEDLVDVDQDGYASSEAGGLDCNDGDVSIYPGADDKPYDGIDQDCDGKDASDVDGDGYAADAGGDCDDQNPNVHPGALEIPGNPIDENCDGETADEDSDGYNTYDDPADCDDQDASEYPGAIEIPYDGTDQDCADGDLVDVDGDEQAADTVGGADCDDSDPVTYQGAKEILGDGRDNNCDGRIDEEDLDGDGYTAGAGDCDDTDVAIGPGAPELPGDSIDNDCDGFVDERVVLGEQDPGGCSCNSSHPTEPFGRHVGLLGLVLLPVIYLRRRPL